MFTRQGWLVGIGAVALLVAGRLLGLPELFALGIRSKDALHVACAVESGCEFFITTDDSLLKKLSRYTRIAAVDPTAFVRSTEP